jgi:hypothetical protein
MEQRPTIVRPATLLADAEMMPRARLSPLRADLGYG